MNLLLLLSALLSGLTGLGTTARAPQVARAAVEVASARPAEPARPRIAARPAIGEFSLFAAAEAPVTTTRLIIAGQPIWAARRRE